MLLLIFLFILIDLWFFFMWCSNNNNWTWSGEQKRDWKVIVNKGEVCSGLKFRKPPKKRRARQSYRNNEIIQNKNMIMYYFEFPSTECIMEVLLSKTPSSLRVVFYKIIQRVYEWCIILAGVFITDVLWKECIPL